ncbi:unnamed protein product [Pylaiella littoralis]
MSRTLLLLALLLPAGVDAFLSYHPGVVVGGTRDCFIPGSSSSATTISDGQDRLRRKATAAAETPPAAPAAPSASTSARTRSAAGALRMGSGSSNPKRSKKKNATAATVAASATAAAAAASTAISREQDLGDFFRWAAGEDIGVKAPKLKGGFVEGLRGLIATQNIAKNDEMVVVPSESALVTTTDQQCPFPEWINKEFWAKSPWYVRLALLLLREKREGADSKLDPWISRLPESFGTPVTWSTAELSELHYSHLEVGAQEQRGEWKGFHSSLVASSPGCGVSEEELSWAMGVAYSRAFRQVEDQSRTAVGPYEGRGPKERLAEVAFVAALSGGSLALGLGAPDQVANGAFAVLLSIPLRDFFMTKLVQLKRYALTPVVDLINHKSGVESDVSYNYFYGYFAVTTQRGWDAGEQVFISYGPRSNDHLLQRYGFVEENNPNDVFRITGLVDKLSALLGSESVRVLQESGGALGAAAAGGGGAGRGGDSKEDAKPVDSVTVRRDGRLGEKEEARVMPVLRLAVVKDDQARIMTAAISLKDFSNEISPANEIAAREALRELCIKERESFPSSLGEDETFLRSLGKSLGANKRVALAFRMEKKRVLNAAIDAMGNPSSSSSSNSSGGR